MAPASTRQMFWLSGAFISAVLVVLVVSILTRLNETSSYLEIRARQEEALRQVAHSLTGALTLEDVLHRITETAALAVDAEAPAKARAYNRRVLLFALVCRREKSNGHHST